MIISQIMFRQKYDSEVENISLISEEYRLLTMNNSLTESQTLEINIWPVIKHGDFISEDHCHR